jgi:uncharacterized protein (DUF1697 family)
METLVALLRGINLGSTNRVSMPELRSALADAGFENVRTYVQSGNILLDTKLEEGVVVETIAGLIADRFDLTVPVVVRSAAELAAIVDANPLSAAAVDPKRFQVSFIDGTLHPDLQETLTELAAPSERVVVRASEIYAWHPNGVARSKLWAKLGAKGGLGENVTATSRNWTTVLTLLEMASTDAG